MQFTAKCWREPLAALVTVMSSLTGCAGVSFYAASSVCPPVVAYSNAEQAHMAEEVAALRNGAVIPEWLADYAVLRDQVRACW